MLDPSSLISRPLSAERAGRVALSISQIVFTAVAQVGVCPLRRGVVSSAGLAQRLPGRVTARAVGDVGPRAASFLRIRIRY